MDNANLAKLRVSAGKLLPTFSPDIAQYTVTVSSSTEEVKISCQTSDSGASCNIKGGDDDKTVRLIEGQIRRIELLVTAEDGKTVRNYALSVKRLSANDAILSALETSIGSLTPRFEPYNEVYFCYLPSCADRLSIKATAEDPAMTVGIADGVTPMDAIPLNPGCTSVQLKVCSANGKGSKHYVINVIKRPIPYIMELQSGDKRHLTCSKCCCILYRPSHTNCDMRMYCLPCLEELTRTNKTDIFTGQKLEGEWLVEDLSVDAQLSNTQVVCRNPTGDITGQIGSIGTLLCKQKINNKTEEPTENCADCSKKIPSANMGVHNELLCLAKYPAILTDKQEVKIHSWEVQLADCTLGNNVQSILLIAKATETEYLTALSKADKSSQELLLKAASCYATVAKLSPGETKAHIGLALIMEELYYLDDIYGIKKEVEMDDETEAEISANQEEFSAICKLHGVNPTDGIAQQLKAVEAEYHSLKLSGQTYKAEHVQQLYAWKSKQASQTIQGSMAIEMEGSIARAIKKLKDCVNINPSDGLACYNLGRLYLLTEEYETAAAYLKAALAIMPLFMPACLCLGLALSSQTPTHAATLLYQGLSAYLASCQCDCVTNATGPPRHEELLSKSFYRPTNTLINEAFITLAELGGNNFLVPELCLLYATHCTAGARFPHRGAAYKRCLWLFLKARSLLLQILIKKKDSMAVKHYNELRPLIVYSGLPATDNLRALQMQVCQMGVMLQPNSSEALCHLGNAQLAIYEANGNIRLLKESELNFKASISQEGLDIDPTVVPEELRSQEWWKKYNTHINESTAKKTELSKKSQTSLQSANKQPASKPNVAAHPSEQTKAVSKTPGTKTTNKTCTTMNKQSSTSIKAATKPPGTSIPPKAASKPSGTSIPPKAASKPSGTSIPPKAASKPSGTLVPPKAATKPSGTSKALTKLPTPDTESKAASKQQENQLQAGSQVLIPTSEIPNLFEVQVAQKEKNKKLHLSRLGMARALAKSPERNSEVITLYHEVITMAPGLHEAYIELGGMLSKTEPLNAADIYCCFPFSNPPSFDDAFLHGEIVRILINAERYDDNRLCNSLILLGKAMGIGVLDKYVTVLEAKFKTTLLKQVFAGVHGKPVTDPDLQQFFKFKCWT